MAVWKLHQEDQKTIGKHALQLNLCIFMSVIQDIICMSEGEQMGLKRHLHAAQSTDKQDAPLWTAPSQVFRDSVRSREMLNNAAVLFCRNPCVAFHCFWFRCSLSQRWHRGGLSIRVQVTAAIVLGWSRMATAAAAAEPRQHRATCFGSQISNSHVQKKEKICPFWSNFMPIWNFNISSSLSGHIPTTATFALRDSLFSPWVKVTEAWDGGAEQSRAEGGPDSSLCGGAESSGGLLNASSIWCH